MNTLTKFRLMFFFILIFLFLSPGFVYSANYKLSDYTLGINNLISADRFHSKVAVLAMTKDYNTFFSYIGIRIFENNI